MRSGILREAMDPVLARIKFLRPEIRSGNFMFIYTVSSNVRIRHILYLKITWKSREMLKQTGYIYFD